MERGFAPAGAKTRRWVTALIALGGIAAVAFAGLRAHRRPDVLLVTIDTLRADHLGCYGDSAAATPVLDSLARAGTVFERAVTPVPLTLPSHATMFTGRYPFHHGVRNNGVYRLLPDAVTLAERFERAGYRTGAFVSSSVLDHDFGLDQGFEAYDDSLVLERPGSDTVRRAIRWIDANRGRPVFVWVHLFEPHTPWIPPPPYRALPLPSLYDQEIAAADACVGRLLAALRARGRLDRTIVTVVADHGEGLGEHGEEEHGVFLYRATTRIPWILRAPGKPAGRRVPELVGTIDLAPTLAELAHLKPLAEPDGRSLAPLLRGRAALDRHGIALETVYPRENFGWAPLAAYRTAEWEWIRAPHPELYNVKADPREQFNRAAEDLGQAALLDARLETMLVPQPGDSGVATAAPVREEITERLRSLGYIAAGALAPAERENLPDPKTMIRYEDDFQEAKRALEEGRPRDAILRFREILARQDSNLMALLGLGMALNRTGRFAEAEEIHERAMEVSPGNPTALGGMADALYGQEDWGEALDLYRLQAADTTAAAHAAVRAAVCLLKLGRGEEASRELADAARRLPQDAVHMGQLTRNFAAYRDAPAASLPRARAAAAVGLVAEAERLAQEPLADSTADLDRLRFLERLYTNLGRPKLALLVLDELIEATGPNSDRHTVRQYRKGTLLFAAGDAAGALAIFDDLPRDELRRAGKLGEFRYSRACALARLGRNQEAMETIARAVRAGYRLRENLLRNPDLEPLRSQPRFLSILDTLSLLSTAETPKS